MSTEADKLKHSRRLQTNDNAINKQLKIATKMHSHDRYIKEPHRLVKHRAMDCGNPKCLLCHREKVFGEKTLKERKFDQDVDHPRDKRSNGLKLNDD